MASLKRFRESVFVIEPDNIVIIKQEDLAVNPKKIKELYSLFSNYKVSNKGCILVLHGPHGSGKSTSAKICAKRAGLVLQI